MKLFLKTSWVAVLITSSALAAQPIKVGVALRFTSDLNSGAASMDEGIELATENFNAKNAKIAIELVKFSHKDGNDSVEHAAKDIVKSKIKYVVGGEMSDEAFTLIDTFKGSSTLLMTPSSSNPLLTAGNPLVFRACLADDATAKPFAKYVAGLKTNSIGVIHHTSNAYSDYLTNAFLDEFEKMKGATVKIHEFRYGGEHPQFESAVDQFKKAKVDTVIAFTTQEPLRNFQATATKAGLNPLYIGSDGWVISDAMKNDSQFKAVRNDYWNSESKSAAVVKFKEQIQKKYKHKADSSNAQAYDAALVLFQAIANSKDPNDVNQVAESLQRDSFSDTVTTKTFRFGRNNSPKKPMYLYEINHGAVKFLKEIAQ
jgi:branched-chain amino acid transport system substrate-binding protein